jgi:2-amino-4-hydroxy-6-hydroxymethyldihydropteridine diphosphokinase
MESAGINVLTRSRLYVTKAHAYIPQADFLNAVILINTSLPAEALLQVLKSIETQAGRKPTPLRSNPYRYWAPRPLDLDIVCYKKLIRNWRSPSQRSSKRVILPHPHAHERAFVLAPLAEIAPFWHHPVYGLTARELLKRPEVRETGKIKGVIGFDA